MRNDSWGLSFIGGAFLLSALFFGLFFRIIGLADASAWGDETATWYFALNLEAVFAFESHTPFFYALGRLWFTIFPETILSLRYLSITLNVLALAMAGVLVARNREPRRGYLLLVLWWLWPVAVIYSRQGRHNALYADLMLLALVLWTYRETFPRWSIWAAFAASSLVHPFALLPAAVLLAVDLRARRLRPWDCLFYLTSFLPVIAYYLFRFLTFGPRRVLMTVNWISTATKEF
jgi:hypothetical protein